MDDQLAYNAAEQYEDDSRFSLPLVNPLLIHCVVLVDQGGLFDNYPINDATPQLDRSPRTPWVRRDSEGHVSTPGDGRGTMCHYCITHAFTHGYSFECCDTISTPGGRLSDSKCCSRCPGKLCCPVYVLCLASLFVGILI